MVISLHANGLEKKINKKGGPKSPNGWTYAQAMI